MLRPSDFVIYDFSESALGSDAVCVGIRPYKDYKDGVAGDVAGFSYDLVLTSRKFEHIALKVPGNVLINPDIFSAPNMSVKIEQIQGFVGRWYKTANMPDYALSCKANSFVIAKEANG